jgi:hypothetical protein
MNIQQQVALWSLFFLICVGLGYPTLNRFDPRYVEGLSDTREYYQLVIGEGRIELDDLRHRILVPYVARPFYWLAKGHTATWDPVLFGLLCSNSLFVATTALLLVRAGIHISGFFAPALVGGLLYLLNFAIANLLLAGYVDSAQACLIMAMTLSLMSDRWCLLPIWCTFGAFAKETSVPLFVLFALGWWIAEGCADRFRLVRALWIAAMGVCGFLTLTLIMHVTSQYTPWSFAAIRHATSGSQFFYVVGLYRSIFNRTFWYVFVWLLPTGIWGLGRLPRTWVWASGTSALGAVAMSAYNDALGNGARALFNISGPLLSLSVAILLTDFPGPTPARPATVLRGRT